VTDTKRRLLYVPVAHSPADMGMLGQRLPAPAEGRSFADRWWQEISQRVKSLRQDWRSTKVYQDGLPDVAVELVERIARQVESPNYELLRWLKAQGAVVLGTESWVLLAEEYEHLRAILVPDDAAQKRQAVENYSRRAPALLDERDEYIAKRIDSTLGEGESGVLFVGLAHQIAKKLPKDIVVTTLP
jgi:hypothetical protein